MKALSKILALTAIAAFTTSASAQQKLIQPEDGVSLEMIEKCFRDYGLEKGQHYRIVTERATIQFNRARIVGDGYQSTAKLAEENCWKKNPAPLGKK